MAAKTLMIQGTTSGAGKSVLATALCRILKQDGFRVAPFKSQNMALNSFVTGDGGEMGRAQVVQAEAAGLEPHVDMNPILLKPEANARCQVVVLGRPAMTLKAGEYGRQADKLLKVVTESLDRLRSAYDIVVIEGAGSPAEINIKENEIVNMRIAKLAEAPVLLVGDIDKGGVFASLVGTLTLLDETERNYIKGFVINKFRGDISLLQPGLDQLEKLTSRPVIGVIPYFHNIFIPQEDSVFLGEAAQAGNTDNTINIAVIHLPHLSNSTDFEPLQQETGVAVRFVKTAAELQQPDVIILPGTKSTIADLNYLWQSGLAESIIQKARSGTPVAGICGGFQMLGKEIKDPYGVESKEGGIAGLGLLDTVTIFQSQKTTRQVKARVLSNDGLLEGLSGEEVIGYEIHMGQTAGNDIRPLFLVTQKKGGKADYFDGVVAADGSAFGSYLHGLFDNANFRYAFLSKLRQRKGLSEAPQPTVASQQQQYDELADLVRSCLNLKLIYQICGLKV
ncbi:MAG: cobyric acid synthase [Dehalococcoidales bacterium]